MRLHTAKVEELDSLNVTAICADYQEILDLGREKAEEFAFYTRGYSLAFQALGYHSWNVLSTGKKIDDEVCQVIYQKLDITLSELAYEKIWDELSEGDRKALKAIQLYLICKIIRD